MLPCVALKYGQMLCAASSNSRATAGSTPRNADVWARPHEIGAVVCAQIDFGLDRGPAGSLMCLWEAATSPMQQADQAAPNRFRQPGAAV
jgi:hypothetical protein